MTQMQHRQNLLRSDSLLRYFQKTLLGRRVTFRRLAGNSFLIYLECEPGDKQGFVIWVEPSWHLCNRSKVLVGSYQSELARGPRQKAGFKKVAPLLNKLIGKKVTSVNIAPCSHDLDVRLSGGYRLRTFADDPASFECWHIADLSKNLVLYGSPLGFRVRKRGIRTGKDGVRQ